jgi:asparagine synthase (glutamine-hydrolysing)
MCGVAGIFYADAQYLPSKQDVKAMTDAIAHRGPDGEGFHLSPGIALGHRRLAVIDPLGGAQPMYNEDRSVAIVFNGEIYNFETIREELAANGHVFRNRCDTEAIVHAWEQWGEACVERLDGMFAFALWDQHRQVLFCARDRLGKKPFHFTEAGRDFVFGSEMAALSVHPGVRRRISAAAVDAFFTYGYVPEPGTIFADIRKLPAGSTLLLRRGEAPRIARYWRPSPARTTIRPAEAAEQLRQRLKTSVAARLVSDVALGAFLSGGVDSGAVVAAAAMLRTAPLDTFTIGFAGAEDETPYAALVAARYHTRQHNEHAAAEDMIAGARIQAAVFGEPFGDSSSVPTLTVCRLARRHATVALSGDGGDEVFAGYRRYRWHRLISGVRAHLPAGVRRRAIGTLAALYPKLDRAPRFLRARHTLTELSLDDADAYARMVTRTHARQRAGLYSASLRAGIEGHDPHAPLIALMQEAADADPLQQAQLADLATWLPGDILTKVDRASMAASLEVRAPFLDHELVNWGLGLPDALKIGQDGGKHILKQALQPWLPREILHRPKQGFATDLAAALRRDGARVRRLLLGEPMLDSGLFDAAGIASLLSQHESGVFNHAQPIWQLLAFEGFLAHQAQTQGAPATAIPA